MRNTQNHLIDLGYNPGHPDGVGGPNTAEALEQFLRDQGFAFSVRATRSSFTLTPVKQIERVDASHPLPWVSEALSVMGLHERHDNEALKEFLRSDGGTVGDPAKIAWCGDFIHTCIRRALPQEPFRGRVGENPYLAMNWLDFGVPCEPCPGAILSFWRGSEDSIYGHVGEYWGEDDAHYYILGGNQDNEVSITKISKHRLRPGGSRWPLSTPIAPGDPVFMSSDIALSVNEA